MRFGISATSLIVPKNFLTRLRPVNVCAIFSLSIRFRRATRAPLLTAAIHRDHRDRRRGRPVLCDSGPARTAAHFTFRRDPNPDHDRIGRRRKPSVLSCPRPPGLPPGIPFSLRNGQVCPDHLDLVSIPQIALSFACVPGDGIEIVTDYFNSTLAPTFSSVALILSASSLLAPSLTVLGAPSTRSLASFSPRPVSARTSLITSIFLSPAAARTTVNSVFS